MPLLFPCVPFSHSSWPRLSATFLIISIRPSHTLHPCTHCYACILCRMCYLIPVSRIYRGHEPAFMSQSDLAPSIACTNQYRDLNVSNFKHASRPPTFMPHYSPATLQLGSAYLPISFIPIHVKINVGVFFLFRQLTSINYRLVLPNDAVLFPFGSPPIHSPNCILCFVCHYAPSDHRLRVRPTSAIEYPTVWASYCYRGVLHVYHM